MVLTPVCILLGASATFYQTQDINWFLVALTLLAALSSHISVNTFNEHADFKSGLDFKTQRTAFSGGSGALPANPDKVSVVLFIAIFSLSVAMCIGLYFVGSIGFKLIPLGLLGVLLVVSYTPWINHYAFFCLIAPGLGFAGVMVLGSGVVLSGQYSTLACWAALITFFLVNNLLLLNQYPDIEADRVAGRKHFAIRFGVESATVVYGLFAALAFSSLALALWLDVFPLWSALAFLPLPLAIFVFYGAVKYQASIGKQPQFLAANVALTLIMPTLLALSLVLIEE